MFYLLEISVWKRDIGLSCYFKCMVVHILVDIVSAKYVIIVMWSDFMRQKIGIIDRNKMNYMKYTINMNN